MASDTVPAVAAQWMVHVLQRDMASPRSVRYQSLCSGYKGLGTLYVKELMVVWRAMKNMAFVRDSSYAAMNVGATTNKASAVCSIRRYFYVDYPRCKTVNQAAITEMTTALPKPKAPPKAATTSAAAPAPVRPNPAAHRHAIVPGDLAAVMMQQPSTSFTANTFVLGPSASIPSQQLPPSFAETFGMRPPGSIHGAAASTTQANASGLDFSNLFAAQARGQASAATADGTLSVPVAKTKKPAEIPHRRKSTASKSVPSPHRRMMSVKSDLQRARQKAARKSHDGKSSKKRSHSASFTLSRASYPPDGMGNRASLPDASGQAAAAASKRPCILLDGVQKQKEKVDYTKTPKNPHEAQLLSTCLQMGIRDPREILRSVRKLEEERAEKAKDDTTTATNETAAPQPRLPLTADDVMLEIITQRENANDARMMDQARLLSEQSRKEEAARRRGLLEKEFQNELLQAPLDRWLRESNMFPKSWILASDARSVLSEVCDKCSTAKSKLIALVKLEKKAQKWYGSTLPRAYFAWRVAGRLLGMLTAESMLLQLQTEVDSLEKCMYSLSEQDGQVPRIILQAHDDAKAEGWVHPQQEDGADEDDDDEVILIDGPPAAAAPKKLSPSPPSQRSSQSSSSSNGRAQLKRDIVEIDLT